METATILSIFISGLLLGIAAITRPEQLLGLILLWVFILIYHRSRFIYAFFAGILPYGLWIISLSIKAQQLIFTPRHWEGYLLGIWEFMPRRLALRLYGMGLYSPEARDPLISPTRSSTRIDAWEGIVWLYQLALELPVLWLIGGFSIIFGLFTSQFRSLSLIALGIALPLIAAAFLPQARAAMFPQANIIPLLMVLVCAMGCVVTQLCTLQKKHLRYGGLLTLLVAHITLSTFPELPTGIDTTSPGAAARIWLAKQSPKTIMSSYENAPLVWTGPHTWEQQSTGWECRSSDLQIHSSVDQDWLTPNKPKAFWANDREWVMITTNQSSDCRRP